MDRLKLGNLPYFASSETGVQREKAISQIHTNRIDAVISCFLFSIRIFCLSPFICPCFFFNCMKKGIICIPIYLHCKIIKNILLSGVIIFMF